MSDPLRILILEDNPADAELVQFELQEASLVFTSKVVMTENEYVEAIRDHCPDLILSDYDLPKYTGALALAEAKKRCPDTPFILVTGAVTEDRAIDILTQGAKDYVLKTRLEQRLVPAVRRALAEAEEHRARSQAEAELREAHGTLEERVKIRTAELQEQIETRKRTEEALRDSEERQRLVLQASSMGTFEVDLLTGEGQWNATEFELLGLKPGDVKASPDAFFRFVHPDDVERLRNQWAEALRSGKLDAEFRIVRADGQERWLAGKGQFFSDGKPEGNDSGTRGEPLRFMGVNFDITGRRKAEEAVAAVHRHVQSIIDNSTAIIYAFDLEGRFVMANAAVAELLNSTPEQMIGKRRHDFMPKDDADWHEANDRQAIEAGRALEFEEYSQLKDRSITWFTTKFPLRDAEGRIYGVAGISADVSERKQAQEMLRESEERYRGVVENTTAIILRLDPRGVITFANSRALEFFGYTADELIGRHNVGSIVPGRESSGRDLAAMVDQIVAYPDRFHSNANENICRDGRRVWLDWTNSGIYMADGRLKELLCVGIDATVRKQAEEALKLNAAIMETVAEGIFLIGLDDNIIKWTNRKFEQLFGYGPGEMVGMHVDKVNAPTDRTPTEARISIVEVLRQAGEWHGEIENIKKDGTHFWCRIHVSLFNHPDFGAVMVSAHTDITERKRAEEAVSRSQKTFCELVERSPFGTYVIDSRFRIAQMNAASQDGAFRNVRPVIGRDFAEAMRTLWPEPVAAEIIAVFRHTLDTGEPYYSPRFVNPRHDVETVESYEWELHRMTLPDGQYGVICYYFDSTNLREAERALHESEQKYRNLVQQAPTGIYDIDFTTGRFTEVNDAMCKILGYTRDELLAMTPSNILDEEGKALFASRIRRAQSGEPLDEAVEYRVRTKEGRIIWSLLNTTFHWDGGKLAGATVVAHDITERRRAEEALRESEAHFRSVLDNSRDVIYRLNLQTGRFEYISPAAEAVVGFSPDELMALDSEAALAMIHPDDVPAMRAALARLEETGQTEIEYRQRTKRGDYRLLSNHMCLTRDDAGRPLYRDGSMRDFTERKRMEEELRLTADTFEKAFHGNVAAMAMSRLEDGSILEVNDRWLELTGYGREEILGKGSVALGLWKNPADRDAIAREVRQHGTILGREYECIRKDGREWTALFSAQVITLRGERVLITSAEDISEIKRAEEGRKEKTKQLEDANRELESFSYSVSHDLRAPLRAIDGYSRMILTKQGENLDEETRQRLQMIKDNTEKMGRLIDDLLALSRLGSLAVTKKELNMERLVSEVWSELLAMHPGRKMTLKNGPMPMAWGDRSLIWQVYSNLLDNAAKFTRGRESALIETGGFVRNGEMIYYVRDNGVGFDMQYHDRLFGAFPRLHSEEEYKGTGIGLALVKRIIERHDGKVWAEGEEDEGATFYFTLPIS
ncbi:MAG: PAS domain S-box protein [Deltaproteobacteria bacterium]|nr:PAS domain S-box protein [Deltaproteobacteria bacterium]